MHLHGYKFWVLGTGRGDFSGNVASLNTRNPPLLDTMNVEGNSWLYLRFVADNPGAWIMHCVRILGVSSKAILMRWQHLDFHHREEMAIAFVVAPDRLRAQTKMADLPMCDTHSSLVSKYGRIGGSPISKVSVPAAGGHEESALASDTIVFAVVSLILLAVLVVGAAVIFFRRGISLA